MGKISDIGYSSWIGFIFLPLLYSCSYSSKACQKMLAKVKNRSFDMIVVPGVPLEEGKWSPTMKGRVYWAKYLYDQGVAKNIMFSGAAVYTPYYEGLVMGLYAEAIGIPKEHIYAETKAEHSTENIYYSYKKTIKLGFKTVALASDPFQTKLLAVYSRRKVDKSIVMIPMVVDTLKSMEPNMIDPVINFDIAAAKDFVPITQREGFWKRLRGTRGGNVDARAYE